MIPEMLYGVPANSQPNASQPDAPGIACPTCGCRHLSVYRTRPLPGERIRRERKCRNCGRLVLTTERVVGS